MKPARLLAARLYLLQLDQSLPAWTGPSIQLIPWRHPYQMSHHFWPPASFACWQVQHLIWSSASCDYWTSHHLIGFSSWSGFWTPGLAGCSFLGGLLCLSTYLACSRSLFGFIKANYWRCPPSPCDCLPRFKYYGQYLENAIGHSHHLGLIFVLCGTVQPLRWLAWISSFCRLRCHALCYSFLFNLMESINWT